jgi:UDP-N-acetylmuramoyl-L-alanyl-D-glutamate--2,6-diaminopimelate ligase
VTGTNGKTTVAWLLAQALGRLGNDCAYIGTLGFGRPEQLGRHALTTPDCFTLHRELFGLASASAAIEVSSHGLAQDRVAGLDFEAAAVTNLSRDHLDAHGSMEAYARTKSRIVELPGLATVVLNIDDAFAAALVARVPPSVRTLRVSRRGGDAEINASIAEQGFDGLELDVRMAGARARLVSPLLGDFNAENLLVVLGLIAAAGHDLDTACASLAGCRPAPGRLEVFRRADGLSVIVDYAHTPAALERTLAVVARLGCRGEIVAVFGCGGDRDPGKRPLMGAAAAAAARVVLTDDNPRGEDPRAIVAQIRHGLRANQPFTIEHDRALAIGQAIAAAGPDDVVLVAGKGHEDTQTVGRTVRSLDDRAIVQAAVGALS